MAKSKNPLPKGRWAATLIQTDYRGVRSEVRVWAEPDNGWYVLKEEVPAGRYPRYFASGKRYYDIVRMIERGTLIPDYIWDSIQQEENGQYTELESII